MRMRYSFSIVMVAALAIAFSGTAAWAATNECGLVGTWSGYADHLWPSSSMAWLAVHTAGSKDAKNGEMVLNFVWVDSGLLTPGWRMTPGHGVFEQIGNGPNAQYRYTWYAYAIGPDGYPLFSVRVSGLAQNTTCDKVLISYTYEAFEGVVAPQDMSNATLIGSATGTAGEDRVPLTP